MLHISAPATISWRRTPCHTSPMDQVSNIDCSAETEGTALAAAVPEEVEGEEGEEMEEGGEDDASAAAASTAAVASATPRVLLELCSGTAIVSHVAERTGWQAITVDHDPRHGATHCEDIMTMDYKALPTPNHLHASVDCTTYTLAAHGTHRLSEERAAALGLLMGLPISEAARKGDALLARVLEIVEHFLALNPRMTVSIENPRGYLRHHPAMQLLRRVEATYGSYGWPSLKPTDFWVNFPLELTYEPTRPTELLISKAPAAALRKAFRPLVSPLGIDVDAVESNASLRSMMPPALVERILEAAAAATQIFPWPDAAVVSEALARWDAQSRVSMAASRKRSRDDGREECDVQEALRASKAEASEERTRRAQRRSTGAVAASTEGCASGEAVERAVAVPQPVVQPTSASAAASTAVALDGTSRPAAKLYPPTGGPPPPAVSPVLENAPPSGGDGSSPPGSHTGETLGSGGCVAVALDRLGVITPVEVAKERLNAQMAPFSAKSRPDQRVPEFVGEPDDHWHKEVVKMAVVEAGYHFQKLDLKAVDLAEVLKSGRYLIDGVLNDSFVKLDVKGEEVPYDTDPADESNPRENEAGWRHAIAVQDGRVLEREFDMSSQWLWLQDGSTPCPKRGYMLKVLVVYRLSPCGRPGSGCRGECAVASAPPASAAAAPPASVASTAAASSTSTAASAGSTAAASKKRQRAPQQAPRKQPRKSTAITTGMFPYFGTKASLAKHLPPPTHNTIVELFAGSAAYALRYATPATRVVLIEKNRKIAAVWRYLQKSSTAEILALPIPSIGENLKDYKQLSPVQRKLISMYTSVGNKPHTNNMTVGKWTKWNETTRRKLSERLERVRGWTIVCGDYRKASKYVEGEATWYFDPPYEGKPGRSYGPQFGSAALDYAALAAYVRSRHGQVIVSERASAAWLPFEQLKLVRNRAAVEYWEGLFYVPESPTE